jgi:hypothetical protein
MTQEIEIEYKNLLTKEEFPDSLIFFKSLIMTSSIRKIIILIRQTFNLKRAEPPFVFALKTADTSLL